MNIYEPCYDPVTRHRTVRTNCRQSRIQQLVVVDTVAKVKHVQLGRHCRKRVIFTGRMSNVLSTFGRLCRIRQNQPCRI